jgi:phage baseplate assembly protein V
VNHHVFATSENGRKIDCIAWLGVINTVDLTQNPPTATVDGDDFTSDWLPMGISRAGPDTEWDPFEAGEQVLVVCPYGDTSQGVIVCAVNQANFPPPSGVAGVWRKQFQDGTFLQYDRNAHVLTVDATASSGTVIVNCQTATTNCQTATVNGTESVTLNTPDTHCTGNLQVDGNATINGNTNVQESLAVVGNANIEGGANVSGTSSLGNVTSNGTDIGNKHYHDYNGNPTTAPVG